MELKININQITKIYIYPEREKSNRYVWKDAQPKTFWNKAKPEGFKDNSDWGDDDGRIYTNEEVYRFYDDNRYFIEDKIVYVNPKIEISFSDKSEERKYFNTLQELNDFMDRNGLNNKNFIKIVK